VARTTTSTARPAKTTTSTRPRPATGHRPLGTYTDWNWPATGAGSTAYTGQDLDLTVLTDPGPTTTYFFAHQIGFEDGVGAYIGLQTRARTGPGPGAADGRIALFSVFAGCDDVARTKGCSDLVASLFGVGAAQPIPGNGSSCQALTNPAGRAPEGPGASCRVPFDWRGGVTYRLRITAAGPHTWLGSVVDISTGAVTEIGRIRVPDPWGGLSTFSVSWIEYYGDTTKLATCGQIPRAAVRWEAAGGTQLTTGTGLLGLGSSSLAVRPTSTHDHLAVGPDLCPNSSITALRPPALGAEQVVGG